MNALGTRPPIRDSTYLLACCPRCIASAHAVNFGARPLPRRPTKGSNMSTNHAKPLGLQGRVGTTVLAATSVCLALVGTQANTVHAATPSIQTLNPEPPPSYTCTAIGFGVTCSSDTVVVLDPEPAGITCGSGPGAFEVMDQGTRRVKAVRWYDRDGNLVKRVRDNLFSDARL